MDFFEFASDNTSGVHPLVMDELLFANRDNHKSYGADDETRKLESQLADLFEHDLRVFLVTTGTAANALALAQLVNPWGSILCHETAHIAEDECGAPEFFTDGAKLVLLPGDDGKFSAKTLGSAIAQPERAPPHNSPLQALSISNATEFGTRYNMDELAEITDIARKHQLKVHMDGARFANIVARSGMTPAELTWRAGVDVLSFGFTKNGALAAEAVIFFDTALAENFEYRRKRSGHLISKHRFLTSQVRAMLQNELWLKNAHHANAMADYFAAQAILKQGVHIAYPVEANEVFLELPKETLARLSKTKHQFYRWESKQKISYRFVSSFNTTRDQIDQLIADF